MVYGKRSPFTAGYFVSDIKTNKISKIARTDAIYSDFVYWNFSCKAPGVGEGEESDDDGELARWRSASFMAVSGKLSARDKEENTGAYNTIFKARTGALGINNVYVNPIDGIYLRNGAKKDSSTLALVKTGMNGTLIDPEAVYVDEAQPESLPVSLPVTEMGVERDGFRGNSIAINVSMGTEGAGWAGIYLMRVPSH